MNRERVAWLVVWLSFGTFCLLIVGVPLGARAYVVSAQMRREATVESLVGTVVVERAVGSGPVPLGRGTSMAAGEGTVIRVDETSEAMLTFFDFTNLHLARGTTLRIDQLRSPRYRWGTSPTIIHLTLMGGRVSIGTALALESPLDLRISTVQGVLTLAADGSYVVEVTNERTDITANRGQAWVTGQGQTVALEAHQRTVVALNRPPDPAQGAARELLVNGELQAPLDEAWRVFNEQGSDGGDVDGTVAVVVDDGRRAVRLSRTGGQGNHCETILEQRIDRDLADMTSLVLRASVKVSHQSLSGGGYLSSEFPLMVRITYRDAYDSETDWVQGFYYQNIANSPIQNGKEIAHDQWFLYESPNLLETLRIRPARIIAIRIYASGWDYESYVSDVSLVAE